VALIATSVHAQVDCSNPDNLCTGDPCTIQSLEVASPCVVDFGARSLVVAGILRFPESGVLSLDAGSILVLGQIRSRNPGNPPPSQLTLRSDGNLEVRGPIDMRFRGEVVLEAGTDVILDAGVNARNGTLTVDAVGSLTTTKILRANTVTLRGGDTLEIGGAVKATDGITAETTGSLNVLRRLVAKTTSGFAGNVVLRGQAGVTIGAPILTSRPLQGGDVEVTSSAGDIIIASPVDASGRGGGDIVVAAAGGVTVQRSLVARSKRADPGGNIRIDAASSAVSAVLNASGPAAAGNIRLNATSGNLTLGGALLATGAVGGVIEAVAAADLTADASFRAVAGGCIALAAGGTLDTTGASFDTPPVADCPGSPSGAFLD
jgi:hypothetical protein